MRRPTLVLGLAFLVAVACGGRPVEAPVAAPPEPTPTAQASTLAPTPSPSPQPKASAVPSASATARPSRELVFVEFTTGRRFSLQTDPAASDLGHFAYSVPDLGAYSGFAGTGLQVSATEILLDHTGPATFIAFANAGQGATPAPRGPGKVTVRVQARLDPVTRTGTVTLTHGAAAISMVASVPSVADLDAVALTFERATVAGDAAALYTVVNSDVTNAYTPAAFAQHWASEEARVGTIAALRRLSRGPPTPTLGDFGFWVAAIEYEAEKVSPTGARSIATYDAYFVRERSGWKLFFTTEK